MVILYGKAADKIAIHRVEEKKKWFVRKIREGAEILMDIQNKHLIRQEILREISHAKKSIIIEHAYFTDSMIIRRLRRLSKSGVKVIVIMPNRSDGVWHANMQSVQKLLSPDLSTGSTNENIEVYLYQGMIHAKVIVIDDTTAILGSANLTYGSFDLLHETNALFRGSESVVKSLISQIQKDMNYCTRVTLNTLPDYNRWIAWFQRIFI